MRVARRAARADGSKAEGSKAEKEDSEAYNDKENWR